MVAGAVGRIVMIIRIPMGMGSLTGIRIGQSGVLMPLIRFVASLRTVEQ